jgi:hypothetical protein
MNVDNKGRSQIKISYLGTGQLVQVFLLCSTVPFDYAALVYKQIRMEGFLVYRWMSEWKEGAMQLVKWIHEVIKSIYLPDYGGRGWGWNKGWLRLGKNLPQLPNPL